MMVIRNCIKPNSAYSGRPTGPIRTPGAERTAGMKEPTKENQQRENDGRWPYDTMHTYHMHT